MEQTGYSVDLIKMALYAIPTGIVALILAAIRFTLFDRRIAKKVNSVVGSKNDGGVSQ